MASFYRYQAFELSLIGLFHVIDLRYKFDIIGMFFLKVPISPVRKILFPSHIEFFVLFLLLLGYY